MAKFLKERSRYLINRSVSILLYLILFAILMIIVSQYFLIHPIVTNIISSILLLVAGIIFIIVWKKTSSYWEKVSDNYDKGDTGELQIQKILTQLPDEYQIIPDIQKPQGGNIDFVVVGPTGIFALEVKNYKGSAKIGFNGKTLTFNGKSPDKDPLGQTISNAITLSKFLKNELNQPYLSVMPILVFTGRQILRFGLHPVKNNARVIRSEFLLSLLTQKNNQTLGSSEVTKIAEKIKTAFQSHQTE